MISMEVGSFTIIAAPYSIFPSVFARGIVELAVNKRVPLNFQANSPVTATPNIIPIIFGNISITPSNPLLSYN